MKALKENSASTENNSVQYLQWQSAEYSIPQILVVVYYY